ncbi:MAG: PPC domain-containing protein [Cyanophyceae cyanobacterium]
MKVASVLLISVAALSPLWLPGMAWGETFELEVGDPTTGELTEEEPVHLYTFEGEEEQSLNILLTSADFDTVVTLLDPDGEEMLFNDDSAGYGLNSRIGPVVLPEAGDYTIVVDSFGHHNSGSGGGEIVMGSYTLSLSEAVVESLEFGSSVTGSLSPEAPFAFFSFENTSGGFLTANLIPDGFEGILMLQDEEGFVINSVGYEGYESDQLTISGRQVVSEGLWVVGSVDGSSSGDFELVVESIEPNLITLGEEEEGSVRGAEPALFSFEAEANTVIDIRVTGEEDLDTYMTLTDPTGYELAYGDDNDGLNPAIEAVILPSDGIYTIAIHAYDPAMEGSFQVVITEREVPDATEEEQTLSFSPTQQQQILQITGEEGDRYQLQLEQSFTQEPESRELAVTVLNGDQTVAEFFERGSFVGRTLELELPESGTYYLRISDYSYAEQMEWESTVTVSVEQL